MKKLTESVESVRSVRPKKRLSVLLKKKLFKTKKILILLKLDITKLILSELTVSRENMMKSRSVFV